MFIYRLTTPIDEFEGLLPLPQWLASASLADASWSIQAILALADAAPDVSWRGDMRHLPSVGTHPQPPTTSPYLVVKQNDNGATFIISPQELSCMDGEISTSAHVPNRDIGAWTHPTIDDLPTDHGDPAELGPAALHAPEPAF
jgi:hypothetical protein